MRFWFTYFAKLADNKLNHYISPPVIDSNPQYPASIDQLLKWSAQQVNKPIDSVKPINGDAGFRQYYRLACDGKSLLAVYAPPATEKNSEFVQLANMLCSAGVIAPEVYSVDYDQGFLLISDLGNQLLFDLLNEETVKPLYLSLIHI